MLTHSQQVAVNAAKFLVKVAVTAIVLWIVMVLFLSLPARGQELPKAPVAKVKVGIVEKVELFTLAGSAAADYGSTEGMLGRGWKELNPAFGPHPSHARLWGVGAAITSAQGGVLHYTEQSRHAWVRWLGRAGWLYVTEEHVRFTIHNRGLGRPRGRVQ
jgi:hypothetical protein